MAKEAGVPDLESFSRFVDGDDLSMTLRSHLALEVILNSVLERVGPKGSELPIAFPSWLR